MNSAYSLAVAVAHRRDVGRIVAEKQDWDLTFIKPELRARSVRFLLCLRQSGDPLYQ